MKKHRFAFLMALGAYPMLIALLYGLPTAVTHKPHWVKGLFMVPVMVGWMLYVVSPAVHRCFSGWLGMRK